MVDQVERFLEKKYHDNEDVRKALSELYHRYVSWGIKDNKFEKDFTDGRNDHFYPYIWEMLLAQHLKDLGYAIQSDDEGPDFQIKHEGQTIWIEATCPTPKGLPEQWLRIPAAGEPARAMSVPHEAMLLRWTAALKEKKDKLTGRTLRNGEHKPGYLDNGIVGPNEPYVVAVNSCRLGRGPSTLLHHSISQRPFALEAAIPLGPIEVVLDRTTGKQINQRFSYRPNVKNANNADVPTDNFFNPDYAGVSAILGSPAGINAVCGEKPPMALIHNPFATNKLPTGILGADEEYVIREDGDEYIIELVNEKK